jgi:hypothetical protein
MISEIEMYMIVCVLVHTSWFTKARGLSEQGDNQVTNGVN